MVKSFITYDLERYILHNIYDILEITGGMCKFIQRKKIRKLEATMEPLITQWVQYCCRTDNLIYYSLICSSFSLGSHRVSYIVSQYGRSLMSKDALLVDSQDKLYIFQAHAGINILSFSSRYQGIYYVIHIVSRRCMVSLVALLRFCYPWSVSCAFLIFFINIFKISQASVLHKEAQPEEP